MTFVFKKFSNYGAENPIVARTVVQTQEVLQFFHIDKAKKDRALEIYIQHIQPRLLRCMEIADIIKEKVNEISNELGKKGPNNQLDIRIIEIPQIIRLEEYAENYLYNAKSTLRDAALVFEPFFGVKFSHSKYNEIRDWSERVLGHDAPMTQFLSEDEPWIKRVVDMRNTIEHPSSKLGPLHISNFEMFENPSSKMRIFRAPVWFMEGEEPSSIEVDMGTTLHNILGFTEELLIVSYIQLYPESLIQFAEIPENERDAKCPIRLRAVLNPKKLKT